MITQLLARATVTDLNAATARLRAAGIADDDGNRVVLVGE